MLWADAVEWADQLVFAGFSDWRLPSAYNLDGSGPGFGSNIDGSELGHMYYNNLGGTSNNPVLVSSSFVDGNGNTVSFQNLQAYSYYWFGTQYDTDEAWLFQMNAGYQLHNYNGDFYYAWAVRDGDVTPVPVPSTISNLLISLMALSEIRIKHHITRSSGGLGR